MSQYPDGRSLESYAQAIWATAKRGREAARQGDADAISYSMVLAGIPSGPGPASLHKLALNAATDIHRMINGEGGTAA